MMSGDDIIHLFFVFHFPKPFIAQFPRSHFNANSFFFSIKVCLELFYTKGNTVQVAKTLDELFVSIGFFAPEAEIAMESENVQIEVFKQMQKRNRIRSPANGNYKFCFFRDPMSF